MEIRNIVENILFVLICVSIVSSLYLLFIDVPFVAKIGDEQGDNSEEEKQDINLSEAQYPTAKVYDGSLYATDGFNLTTKSGIKKPRMLVEKNTEQIKSADNGILEFQNDSSRFEIQWDESETLIQDKNKNQFYVENPVLQDGLNITSNPEGKSLTNDSLIMIDGLVYYNNPYGNTPEVHDRTPERNLSFDDQMADIMKSVDYSATEAKMRPAEHWSSIYTYSIKYEDQEKNVESTIVVTSEGRIEEFNYSGPEGNVTYSTEINIEVPLFRPIWAVES